MPEKGLFSGNFDLPVGALDLFEREDENSVDPGESIIQHLTDPNIDIEGVGSGGVIWARVNAAGTKIVGSGVGTTTRDSEGVYDVPLSTAITAENYAVVVTPSAEAGNGGDGAVKFQAYDSHLIEDVAAVSGGTAPFDLLNTTDGKTYALDPATDEVVIHNLATFTTNPAGTSMGGEPLSGFGCLDREGRLLWMGEDGSGTSKHLIAYDTTNSTIYDFGDIATSDFGGWSWSIIAAEYNSGSPKLWIDIIGAGGLKRYTPNLGTETLGAAAFSYTGYNHEGSQPATWDDSGTYFYAQQSTYLYRVLAAASSGNGLSEHDYPSAYVTGSAGGNNCLMVWDSLRKKLYVPLTNGPGGGCSILAYTPATALANDNGTWQLLLNTASATSPNIWLDQASGVLLVQEGNYVHRYILSSMQLVDSVDVSALTSPTAGVPQTKARLCYYSHPYAYLFTYINGATPDGKHLRISYQGAELSQTGYGAYISSVLTAMYEVIDNDTIKVYLFRSLDPIIRADGEFSIVVASGTAPGSNSGTVSSVAVTMPDEFAVAGSPVTTSGTVAVTWDTQSANTILAGPTSGGAATPTYRALTTADLPATVGAGAVHGQCKLTRDTSTQLKLVRAGGYGGIIIDGVMQQVPAAGVTASISNCYLNGSSGSSLSNDTTYYAYVFMNAGTMTLDFSTTGYADSNGVNIKSGASTRTLVGMVRPSGGVITDTAVTRFVRSWFNQPSVTLESEGAYSGNLVNTATWTTWGNNTKIYFLTWADEKFIAHGTMSSTSGTDMTNGAYMIHHIAANGTLTGNGTTEAGWSLPIGGTAGHHCAASVMHSSNVTINEGYNYLELAYYFSSSATDATGEHAGISCYIHKT